ncbi:MAG: helix-turn-helix domain-containing protein [Huintestinicola sp.]|uniref:AraC family transcriptional regulator n=1 Tax=Huintestinicola sp. TaxID=2981661 RepID=UPI003F0C678D
MMIFHAMGMNYRHEKEFDIDRPNGSGDDLLLFFKTAARVFSEEGEVIAPPRSVLLYKKGSPQHYCAAGEMYVNHFLHLECSGEEEFLEGAGIAVNRVIPLSDDSEAEELLRMIGREEMSGSPHKEQYMDMLIKMLILKIADCSENGKKLPLPMVHGPALDGLRAELYSNAGSFGSVAELAEKVNLSPSHFQQLYRERFGVSCYEDLLSARIKAAEYYLKNSSLTVKEIAALCGYENDVCFMRLFKRRTGLTPGGYRRK